MFTRPRLLILLAALLCLSSCDSTANRSSASSEAYVGPMSLPLRAELAPKAPIAATAKHGERVEIVQRRRRFAKVRLDGNREGWVDGRQLLRPDQLRQLQDLWDHAAKLPSLGTVMVWDKLNVHTAPHRQAPSFDQLPEQGRAELVWQALYPRGPYEDPGIDTRQPKRPVKKAKKEKKPPKVPPPPSPPTPDLPENWMDLSRTDLPKEPEPEPEPVPMEDWSLIRTKDGKAGWVLTRALNLAIPDEVAQYAEGKRITSYFSLGEVRSDGQVKHNWLWTTISARVQEHHFDSFRVFIYNTKRHRYETAYIERNVRGYFPVSVQQTDGAPRFVLLLEDKDGQLYRETYVFQGYRVRMVDKVPARRVDPLADLNQKLASAETTTVADETSGLIDRIRRVFRR